MLIHMIVLKPSKMPFAYDVISQGNLFITTRAGSTFPEKHSQDSFPLLTVFLFLLIFFTFFVLFCLLLLSSQP